MTWPITSWAYSESRLVSVVDMTLGKELIHDPQQPYGEGRMSEGHLTPKARKIIRSWRIGKSPEFTLDNLRLLLDTIEDNCRWPDFCIDYYMGEDSFDKEVVIFEFHTGGWSGHEDMIAELQKTFFWMFCWEQSNRGGHYKFRISLGQWEPVTSTTPLEKGEGK